MNKRTDLASGVWRSHRLFGIELASDFPFATPLDDGLGDSDVRFSCASDPPVSIDWECHDAHYRSPFPTASGEPTLEIYRLGGLDVLRFAGTADFYLYPEKIHCHLLDPEAAYAVEIRLLGVVLAFWLERGQIPMLHAAAVTVDGLAVAFLAANKGGKSSLAAAFLQDGFPLLTDDILPVEERPGRFFGRPGYPSLRFWPEEAQHFLGHHESLPRVHPELAKRRVSLRRDRLGSFHDQPAPLACIYIPERRDPTVHGQAIEITAESPQRAMIELVGQSFIARAVQAVGWQPRRLACFARLLGRVPVRRLAYPSGFEHLPLVREAVLKDRPSWDNRAGPS
jgi:hypothetical protein